MPATSTASENCNQTIFAMDFPNGAPTLRCTQQRESVSLTTGTVNVTCGSFSGGGSNSSPLLGRLTYFPPGEDSSSINSNSVSAFSAKSAMYTTISPTSPTG